MKFTFYFILVFTIVRSRENKQYEINEKRKNINSNCKRGKIDVAWQKTGNGDGKDRKFNWAISNQNKTNLLIALKQTLKFYHY